MLTVLVFRTAQQPPGGRASGDASQCGAQDGPADCRLAGTLTGTPRRQQHLSTAGVQPRRQLGEAPESQSHVPVQPVGRPAEQQAGIWRWMQSFGSRMWVLLLHGLWSSGKLLWGGLSRAKIRVSWHVSRAARHSQHACSSKTGRCKILEQVGLPTLYRPVAPAWRLQQGWLPPALRRFRKRSKATSSWPCKCKTSVGHEAAAQAPCPACSHASMARI